MRAWRLDEFGLENLNLREVPTPTPWPMNCLMDVIWHQTHIQGITVGHWRSFQDLVRFLDEHTIQPVVDGTFAFEDAHRAYEKLAKGAFGKIVITIA